jgi:hypothetical protein
VNLGPHIELPERRAKSYKCIDKGQENNTSGKKDKIWERVIRSKRGSYHFRAVDEPIIPPLKHIKYPELFQSPLARTKRFNYC